MPKLQEILLQPEGRKLEFKQTFPVKSDIAKTVISFSNDSGGSIYFGIQDSPRKITGLPEQELYRLEEKINSIIYDSCSPIIIPEISFLHIENKHVIQLTIYKGNNPPYHFKNKSIEESTYIRVGSLNKLASIDMIHELTRLKYNISFDSEIFIQHTIEDSDITEFANFFSSITGEVLNRNVLQKLELIKHSQKEYYPTNAFLLLANASLKNKIFPYAKIECARFKGKIPGNFIDQKTIDGSVITQVEYAYQFVLRHISQGTTDYTGVYRSDRWEYPIIALREVIRNAIIHRDYSLTGKDIKIAIFDDSIEITSPGTLLPSIDFNDMTAGQSDIRNKILAPIFKKLGIIEQWGNGLRLIITDLQKYPEVTFEWKEVGKSFRVIFCKKKQQELQQELQQESKQESQQESLEYRILHLLLQKPLSRKEISVLLGQRSISGHLNEVLSNLQKNNEIEWTIKEKPNSSKQKFKITQQGQKKIK